MFASGKTAAVASAANYIEDVFSTYLYTGNGSTQTITNGIDLSTYGGLVWIKNRTAGFNHNLQSTGVGFSNAITSSATTYASTTDAITGFNTTGFNLGSGATYGWTNDGGSNYVSWSFRKQAKFFDVVTWTGNGTAGRTISHNLGSVPGAIFVKRLSNGYDWEVYHTSIGNNKSLVLNDVAAAATRSDWNNTTPTSTQFTVGSTAEVNASGGSYVAYLFAHNAGGFGLSGSDNVISCGSYTGNGSATGPEVNLGFEPQWVMVKLASGSYPVGDWGMFDNMRGFTASGGTDAFLYANASDAESNSFDLLSVTSTGFKLNTTNSNYNASGTTYIYIAIRRGPMKVPTSGTSVFLPTSRTGNASLTTVTSDFATDVVLARRRDTLDNGNESVFADKLRGSETLSTNNTAAEYAGGATSGLNAYTNTGVVIGTNNNPIYAFNYSGLSYALYQFQRAPNFMDEVCYTGTEVSGQTFNHNLGVVPEMMIVKARDGTTDWTVYHSALGASARIYLNATNAANTGTAAPWNSTTPTSTVFSLGNAGATNLSGTKFVNYLFATCAGVSKVGSYTGTGTTKQVDCGFTGGARFVLIKRTDSTGDWYVWDTARGIVSGNDPYLLLNSTAAEVTNTDYVDTYSAGFEISSTAPAAINASGGSFIFLAIA